MQYRKILAMGIMLCSYLQAYTQNSSQNISKKDTLKSDKKYYLQDVQVSGKSANQEVKEKAFHVAAIELKQLENSNRDLQQILNRSTGIKIRESGGLGSNFELNLNGFSGRQIKFFIDGIPLENSNTAFGLQTIPVNNAERIEVLAGACRPERLPGRPDLPQHGGPKLVSIDSAPS